MKTTSVVGYLGTCLMLYAFMAASSLPNSSVLQTVIYTFGYISALSVGLFLVMHTKTDRALSLFSLSSFGARMTVFAFPAVFGIIFSLSWLSAALSALTGSAAASAPSLTMWAFVRYACFVPIAEELFFRYIPLRLCGQEHRRRALLLCVVPFTLFHLGQFRFIYALAAGILFFALDLAARSLVPSVLTHMAVNTLSLLYPSLPAAATAVAAVALPLLCIASAAWCLMHKKEIAERMRGACTSERC